MTYIAVYLTNRDEGGGMQEQMRYLESLADGQTHSRDVRIGSHDLVRCTLAELAKKSPQH